MGTIKNGIKLNFIKYLIKQDIISKREGRFLEYFIISTVLYLFSALITGNPFSFQGLLIAIGSPILGALQKRKRDIAKDTEYIKEQLKDK